VAVNESSVVGGNKSRAVLAGAIRSRLRRGESIVALFPFTETRKRPRAPGSRRSDRVIEGVYQSRRRYRPLVLTDRMLYVFDAGRTPHPRALLAEYPLGEVALVDVRPAPRFGATCFVLALPGTGEVPFECGRREMRDLDTLRSLLAAAN
jgi:hypothetical protein